MSHAPCVASLTLRFGDSCAALSSHSLKVRRFLAIDGYLQMQGSITWHHMLRITQKVTKSHQVFKAGNSRHDVDGPVARHLGFQPQASHAPTVASLPSARLRIHGFSLKIRRGITCSVASHASITPVATTKMLKYLGAFLFLG